LVKKKARWETSGHAQKPRFATDVVKLEASVEEKFPTRRVVRDTYETGVTMVIEACGVRGPGLTWKETIKGPDAVQLFLSKGGGEPTRGERGKKTVTARLGVGYSSWGPRISGGQLLKGVARGWLLRVVRGGPRGGKETWGGEGRGGGGS